MTGAHAQVVNYDEVPDGSAAGFTGSMTFDTPGGTVITQFGGSNSYSSNSNVLGQTNVRRGYFAITSSTDTALSTSDFGTWMLFANAVGLNYSDFGVWTLHPCNSTSECTPKYAGTIAGGQPGVGETVTMPTNGLATYTGGAAGIIVQPISVSNSNNAGRFYGTSSITADFATGSVSGSITGITAYDIGTGSLQGTVNNIAITGGTISGSEYGATTSVTGSAGTAYDISGATGLLKGAFYGPNANETAGVFYLSGGANSVSVTGSFGAKQAAPSDRRVKREIKALGELPNGLPLYSWRYLGGAHRFTGVMAQDLLADSRFAGAVEVDSDGLMRVDYGRIGYAPANFDAMVAEGEQAVACWNEALH